MVKQLVLKLKYEQYDSGQWRRPYCELWQTELFLINVPVDFHNFAVVVSSDRYDISYAYNGNFNPKPCLVFSIPSGSSHVFFLGRWQLEVSR